MSIISYSILSSYHLSILASSRWYDNMIFCSPAISGVSWGSTFLRTRTQPELALSLKLVFRGVLEVVMLVKLVQLVVELAHLEHLGVQLAIAPWPHIVLVKCLNFTLQTPHTIRGVPATLVSIANYQQSHQIIKSRLLPKKKWGDGVVFPPNSRWKLKVHLSFTIEGHWPPKNTLWQIYFSLETMSNIFFFIPGDIISVCISTSMP